MGYVTRKVVEVSLKRFIHSWNNHRIPGPQKGISMDRARENCPIAPLNPNLIPDYQSIIQEHVSFGETVNEEMSDKHLFRSEEQNNRLYQRLGEALGSDRVQWVYNRV